MLILFLEVRVLFAEEPGSAGVILFDAALPELLGDAFEWSIKDVGGPLGLDSRAALGSFSLHRAEDVAPESVVVPCTGRLLGLHLVWLHSEIARVLVSENVRILEGRARHRGYQGAVRVVLFPLGLRGRRGVVSVCRGQDRTLERVVLSGAGGVSLLH